jgi:hypothetical protein
MGSILTQRIIRVMLPTHRAVHLRMVVHVQAPTPFISRSSFMRPSGIQRNLTTSHSGLLMVLNLLCGVMAIRKLLHLGRCLVFDRYSSTGYGIHADYVFGWKGDSLQRAMNANCDVSCPTLKTQTIAQANKCLKSMNIKEEVDGCELSDCERWVERAN